MARLPKTARRVYSTEELHRLRESSSAPRLSEAIEEHEGEDAELIKGEQNVTFHAPVPQVVHALQPNGPLGIHKRDIDTPPTRPHSHHSRDTDSSIPRCASLAQWRSMSASPASSSTVSGWRRSSSPPLHRPLQSEADAKTSAVS